MILVLVGTHHDPFDRLMKALEKIPGERIVQYGHCTYLPKGCTNHKFMPFEEVQKLMKKADAVITHAGTGSVMMAISMGKRPVVAPRFKAFHEHVDDHQLDLVKTLEEADLIEPRLPETDLAAAVERARKGQATLELKPSAGLLAYLKGWVENADGESTPRA